MTIKSITAKETFIGGHLVLQPGRPIEDCCFELHNHTSSLHPGMEFNRKIIPVLSALNFECENFFWSYQYEIKRCCQAFLHFKKRIWARN